MNFRFLVFLNVAWLLSGLFSLGLAQNLTLSQAIQLAHDASPLAKRVKSDYEAEKWRFKTNRALLLPQLSLQTQLPGFTRSINSILQPDGSSLFQPQSQNFSSATMSLSQNLLNTGGTLSLNSSLNRFDFFENTVPGQTYYWRSAPLYLQYSQPLFRINQIKWNWEQQKIGFDLSSRQSAEGLEDISIAVTQKFFELCLAKLKLANAEYNLKNNDTIYMISKGRYGIGKIAENDLLQVELGLMGAKNEVERNKLAMFTTEKELRNLIGQNEASGTFNVDIPHEVPFPDIDPVKAVEEAKTNRSDYKQLELNENNARMNLRSAQVSRRFSADLNLSVGFNQQGKNLAMTYNNLQSSQSAFLGLNVPLHNAGRNAGLVRVAEAELTSTMEGNKNRRNNLEIEVYNQVMQLKQLKTSLLISAKSDTIALRRYEMAKNRYLIGKIDITNLSIAQQEKDNALQNYIVNLREYWLAWYQLRRLTLYDFTKNEKLLR